MRQMTFSRVGFDRHGKATRRALLLVEMGRIMPWSALYRLIEPFYSQGMTGRPPVGGWEDAADSFRAALVPPACGTVV